MTEDAFNQALHDPSLAERRAISAPRFDAAEQPLRRVLAAIANTDVLTAGVADVPVGLSLNPAVPEARAGWYSFGFLVRRAAAVWTDIAESKLDLGIQPVMDFSSPFAPPSARVFLSDALENGAGYCSASGSSATWHTTPAGLAYRSRHGQAGARSVRSNRPPLPVLGDPAEPHRQPVPLRPRPDGRPARRA
jgi:hypothetical protein